jgi:CubicO group peptidase (beta-lactamase class C family)
VDAIVESPEAVGISSNRLQRIGPALQRYVDECGYGGFVTRVVRRGQLVHADRIGWQDREAGVPMGDDTIFRIYSMTKPVIYSALMTLYEEGRFQLLDPVSKFLPAFAATKVMQPDDSLVDQSPLRPMQVRDLMTHMSGLSYDFLDDFPVSEQYRQAKLMHDPTRTLATLIADLARIPLAFHPGTKWHYSLGTDVAAHLIEVLSGRPIANFLAERLFGPLGMTETAFGVPAGDARSPTPIRSTPRGCSSVAGSGSTRPRATTSRLRGCYSTARRLTVRGSSVAKRSS